MPRYISRELPTGGFGVFDTARNNWKQNPSGVLVFATLARASVAAQGYNKIESDKIARRCFGKPSVYKGP